MSADLLNDQVFVTVALDPSTSLTVPLDNIFPDAVENDVNSKLCTLDTIIVLHKTNMNYSVI